MTKTLLKNTFREIANSKARFISILAIIALGVGFFAGIKATVPSMYNMADEYYSQSDLMDYRLVSTVGFDKDDVKAVENLDNVKGIIADCGFTSPWDIIKHVAKERFHLPPFPLMYMVDLISEVVAGFGLKEVSIPEIMKRNKIPVLFIHGDADDYVPMWMTIKNYEACAAKKELYIVSGAGHALAFSKDMEEGKRRIKNFINKYKTI